MMNNEEIEYPFQFFLRNVIHLIKQSVNAHMKPYDISWQQAIIIGIIGEKQKQGISICQKDIEKALGITAASITSLLQGLEKKDFIRRCTGTNDERTKELSLNDKGTNIITEIKAILKNTEKTITQGMSNEEKELFLNLLRHINNRFKS